MAIEDFQHVHGFKKILRRFKPEELAAFLEQQLVIGADVAGAVGHNAFVQIAQRTLPLSLIIGIGIAQGIVGALAEARQGKQLLLIGQGRVLNDFQCFRHGIYLLYILVF